MLFRRMRTVPDPDQAPSESPARRHTLAEELSVHLPFSLLAATFGTGLLLFIAWVARLQGASPLTLQSSEKLLFHVFHPTHLFLSAAATTAMFWRHEKRFVKALAVGFFGTVIPCGFSDYLAPFAGGLVMRVPMELHICFVEHPQLVVPAVLLGMALGFFIADRIQTSTLFSHSAHVFVSSVASTLYLVSFGMGDWLRFVIAVFVITVAAVLIPCCFSDIVFPVICVERKLGGHGHP